jgi:MFS family permease
VKKGTRSSLNDQIAAILSALVPKFDRFLEESGQRLLRSVAVLSAVAVLLGAIWATLYYCFVARDVPDLKVDQVAAILVLLSTAGGFFLTLMMGLFGGAGIYLGMSLESESRRQERKDVLIAAGEVFGLAFLCIATFGVAFLGGRWWLIGAAFLVLAIVSITLWEVRETRRLGEWRGGETLGQRIGGFLTALSTGLYLVLFIAFGLVPETFHVDTPAGAAFAVISLGGLSSGLNLLMATLYRLRAAFSLGLAAVFLVLLSLYGSLILAAPFRMLHVGGFEADLMLKSEMLTDSSFSRCFDIKGEVVHAYVIDSLGSSVLLETRDPARGRSNATSDAAKTQTNVPNPGSSADPRSKAPRSDKGRAKPSQVLDRPCVALVSKEEVRSIFYTSAP